MPAATKSKARLNFRLPAHLKNVIEEAAAHLGQSVSDFAVATLVQKARTVISESNVTKLSRRDRDRFLAMLDDESAKPNKALLDAVKHYRQHFQS